MEKKNLKIKPQQIKMAYTSEEKRKLFTEGLVRNMSHVSANKKAYKRKEKHQKRYW